MPWGKNIVAGPQRGDRSRNLLQKICETAKGGSLAMTALALGSAPPSRSCKTKNCPLYFTAGLTHRLPARSAVASRVIRGRMSVES